MTQDEFVTVATCSQSFEAEVIRGRLESEGIEAHVRSRGWADVYFGAGANVGGGVTVQVPERDAVRAKTILDQPANLAEEDLWAPHCPSCGSPDVSASASSAGLLSFVAELLPRDSDTSSEIAYSCRQCGRQWAERHPGLDTHWGATCPKDVQIRECSVADIPAVRALQCEWADEEITYGYSPDEEMTIQEALGPYFLVAQRDGQIIGFASGANRSSPGLAVVPEGQQFLEIGDLYVAQSHRGLGIGKELLAQLLARAKERGASKALVYSATKDTARVTKFYASHGFETWYIQMFKDL